VTRFSHEQALYETLIRQDELLAYIDRQQGVKFCVSYGVVCVFIPFEILDSLRLKKKAIGQF
jgi:hypothetical protein